MSYSVRLTDELRRQIDGWGLPSQVIDEILKGLDELSSSPSRHLAARVDRAVHSLPREKLWVKPFPFGNSVGHLVLHLAGNLNHYVGAKIADTGYARDRAFEFTDPAEYPAEEILQRFHDAVELVVRTLHSLEAEDFVAPVADEPPIETRFGLLLVCAAHLNNHIGQMSYLVQAQGHSTQERPIW